jgi:hypothetical protein
MNRRDIPESDWKYLRSIMPEMLESLCKRVNNKASKIITNSQLSEHERFQRLFEHTVRGNKAIAKCFDDWRRSNIVIKLLALRQEGLFTDKHASRLSDQTREILAIYEGLSED